MTAGQRAVLAALTDGPLTSSQIAYHRLGHPWTYDRAHSALRRMEDSGLVRRLYPPTAFLPGAQWELTHAGRNALNLTT